MFINLLSDKYNQIFFFNNKEATPIFIDLKLYLLKEKEKYRFYVSIPEIATI